MKKHRVPKGVVEQLQVKEPITLQETVDISFYKGQALIRFPTIFNPEIEWKKGDKLELVLLDVEPPEIKCRLIRKK